MKNVKATLLDYIIIGDGERSAWVLPEEYKRYQCTQIIGTIYGKSKFTSGSIIITSKIEKIEGGKAYTKSGSVYQLKNMHKDYAAFVDTKRKGNPILKECYPRWNKMGVELIGRNFENDEIVFGKIICQDKENNTITLEDGITYFVHWIPLSKEMDAFLNIDEDYGDGFKEHFKKEDFEFYGYEKCRPPKF